MATKNEVLEIKVIKASESFAYWAAVVPNCMHVIMTEAVRIIHLAYSVSSLYPFTLS